MRKRIIAIDPGEMTGWAIGYLADAPLYEGGEFRSYTPDGQHFLIVEQCGHDPWKAFVLNLSKVMEGDQPFDTIVYESFRIRVDKTKELTGSDVPTAQCIGAIKLAAWKSGARLVTSEPSNKPVIDKQMGGTEYLPLRDGVEHERDATRHLYWYAVNKRGVDPRDTRRVS